MASGENKPSRRGELLRTLVIRGMPAWIILCGLLLLIAPNLGNVIDYYAALDSYTSSERRIERAIAPLFTPEVDYWEPQIIEWALAYGVDPNLVATVIQIESCGDPAALSGAGATGLMQVMPQHFEAGEDPFDPDTNARRGLGVLVECLTSPYNATRDVGLAFACYNGGPSVFVNVWENWPQQSRDYFIWGTGIYTDAAAGAAESETLDSWLLAGGQTLCTNAQSTLQLTPAG